VLAEGGTDAAPTDDHAAPDAKPDAGIDASGVSDGGTAEAGTVLKFSCDAGPVSSCAACPSNPLPCVGCDMANDPVFSVCAPSNIGHCSFLYPAGVSHCTCFDGGASGCVIPQHVCVRGGVCRTCGEAESDLLACKGSGVCAQITAKCD
jgi:hypothetical protein